MILLIDVGNSNIVFGFSDMEKINKSFRFKTLTDKTSDEYYILIKSMLDLYDFNDVIISSVVPVVTSALKKLFKSYYNINSKIVGPGVKTGIQLKVDDPKTVGADMICDCSGAMIYDKEAIVVDLGTATKYIYVKNNTFYGCSIAPGVSISMKALINNAALLPSFEFSSPKKVIATNTMACLQSGVILGSASQVDGMIDRIKEEIGNNDVAVLATGGLSGVIVPLCKNQIKVKEHLTLEGLLEIYKKNLVA
ncbi:MAG: type III pantothenate kinase [Acholeplasmatales bacterium]|nr:type III pantothenate kinase [Acholeplasmatales bacterium]